MRRVLQVWMPAMNQVGMDALQKQLYSDPELFIMGSAAMMPFRLSRCVQQASVRSKLELAAKHPAADEDFISLRYFEAALLHE